MRPRFHTLRIAEVRRETPEAISLRFDVPPELAADYAFIQGQHVTLKARIDEQEVRRSYSICAGVDDAELRVAIKKVSGGLFSSWANSELKSGDSMEVLTPDGRFHTALDPSHAKHYVAFAAGSGITPVISLIRTMLRREPASHFTLIYGNRSKASALFHEELEDIKDRYLTRFALYNLFSRENQDVELFNGRLDDEKVRMFADTLVPVASIDEAFICGPGAMLDDVETALIDCGMPPDHIHIERFGIAGSVPVHHVEPGDAPHARVTVVLDGVKREVEFRRDDPSILDAALGAGLELPYSCKGGMCCTCRAKVLAGMVRMDKNYSLEQRDLDAGFILACQSHPLTDKVTISYDER
ncbi:MAG: 1,2-phenylacetyl-CoA epoxidase subunit PaaE [Burkholderiales bacterium]